MKITNGYGLAQIGLHWLIAVGVALNYVLSDDMGKALHQKTDGAEVTVSIAGLHVWIGVAVLALDGERRLVLVLAVRGDPDLGLVAGVHVQDAALVGAVERDLAAAVEHHEARGVDHLGGVRHHDRHASLLQHRL